MSVKIKFSLCFLLLIGYSLEVTSVDSPQNEIQRLLSLRQENNKNFKQIDEDIHVLEYERFPFTYREYRQITVLYDLINSRIGNRKNAAPESLQQEFSLENSISNAIGELRLHLTNLKKLHQTKLSTRRDYDDPETQREYNIWRGQAVVIANKMMTLTSDTKNGVIYRNLVEQLEQQRHKRQNDPLVHRIELEKNFCKIAERYDTRFGRQNLNLQPSGQQQNPQPSTSQQLPQGPRNLQQQYPQPSTSQQQLPQGSRNFQQQYPQPSTSQQQPPQGSRNINPNNRHGK